MLDKNFRNKITDLIKREVVPAIGCTEPIAVALAVAKAKELLGECPSSIDIKLSGNIMKNAMGVGIPGTGMIGLPIAIALGATIGKSSYGLEVLKDVNNEAVQRAKSMISENRINLSHASDASSNLYIHVTVKNDDGSRWATVVVEEDHTNFTLLATNEGVINRSVSSNADKAKEEDVELTLNLRTVWDYATETPLEELEFILDAKKLNQKAAELALKGKGMGHKVGKTIMDESHNIFGNTALTKMLAYTSAACDARMAGEPVAVMSNSGSGNQGITITMPVVTYAESIGASHEQTVRALAMAHLTSIYIKQSLGRLSALCGCVVASTGASMALVYLMGGDYEKGSFAVKNMIATLTGMICDGAKPSCSLKIASGVGTAYISTLLAMKGECVTSDEGIIDDSVDSTIQNFSMIGREAMVETDRMVLRIMSGN